MGRRGKREFVQVLRLMETFSYRGGPPGGAGHDQAGSAELRRGQTPRAVRHRGTTAKTGPGAVSIPAQGQREHNIGHRLHDASVREGIVSDRPTLLLEHHLRKLRLPTFLREYGKMAAQCAAEGVDHPGLPAQAVRAGAHRQTPPHGGETDQGCTLPDGQEPGHLRLPCDPVGEQAAGDTVGQVRVRRPQGEHSSPSATAAPARPTWRWDWDSQPVRGDCLWGSPRPRRWSTS